MADLYASRAPVRLNDGTADANNAVISNAAPGASDYALEVRQVGIAAAAALADATANPTVISTGVFLQGFNGTTWDRLRSSTANGLAVDVTRVSGTVTVDTELAAAAALADAYANPTVPIVGAGGLVFNGTTWDRAREVANAQDTTGTGIAAAGILGQFDDVTTGTVTENQFAPVRISSRRALLVEGVASGTNLNVALAASSATVTVDSELPAAAAISADAQSAPTAPGVYGWLMGFNGTNWDRVRVANTGRLQVDVVTGGGGTTYVGDAPATATPTGFVQMGLANAAAPADVSANNDAVALWALRNGSLVVNLAAGGTLLTNIGQAAATATFVRINDGTTTATVLAGNNALKADLSSVGGTNVSLGQAAAASSIPVVISSGQFGTTAALADATSNPSLVGIAGYLMGYNGTTWDRVRTANTGRLQVDVVTGGGSLGASELQSGYNAIAAYGTASAVAAGATSTAVVTNTPANTKAFYVRQVMVAASGQVKWQLKFGGTVLATGFNSQTQLTTVYRFDPPISGTGDGTTALTVDITNREASAMDVYARYGGVVAQ